MDAELCQETPWTHRVNGGIHGIWCMPTFLANHRSSHKLRKHKGRSWSIEDTTWQFSKRDSECIRSGSQVNCGIEQSAFSYKIAHSWRNNGSLLPTPRQSRPNLSNQKTILSNSYHWIHISDRKADNSEIIKAPERSWEVPILQDGHCFRGGFWHSRLRAWFSFTSSNKQWAWRHDKQSRTVGNGLLLSQFKTWYGISKKARI